MSDSYLQKFELKFTNRSVGEVLVTEAWVTLK